MLSESRFIVKLTIPWLLQKSKPCIGLDSPLEFQDIEAPRIFLQLTHEGSKVVSLKHRPPLQHRRHLVTHICRGA